MTTLCSFGIATPPYRAASPAVILLAGVGLLSGCGRNSGPERAMVRGQVTFDGAPVEQGTIVLLPANSKGPSSGGPIQKGEFLLPAESGPVPGDYRVEIRATKQEGTVTVAGVAGATTGPSAGSTEPKIVMFIPDRYNTKSELTAKVAPGQNELTFPLKSKP